MTIKAYSKAKEGNKKLSTNFRVKEFACTDGSDPIRIAVLAVLCLLVPLLAAIILQSSKRHSYEADE